AARVPAGGRTDRPAALHARELWSTTGRHAGSGPRPPQGVDGLYGVLAHHAFRASPTIRRHSRADDLIPTARRVLGSRFEADPATRGCSTEGTAEPSSTHRPATERCR